MLVTQVEAGTRLLKMSFICVRIKNDFQMNGFALSLALKQRLRAPRKWLITLTSMKRNELLAIEVIYRHC